MKFVPQRPRKPKSMTALKREARMGRVAARALRKRAMSARAPHDRLNLTHWIGDRVLAAAVGRIAATDWTAWFPWWEDRSTPDHDRRMFLLWLAIAIEDLFSLDKGEAS